MYIPPTRICQSLSNILNTNNACHKINYNFFLCRKSEISTSLLNFELFERLFTNYSNLKQ